MRLKANTKVSKLEIFAEGEEIRRILGGSPEEDGRRLKVAEIKNPVLMTDPYEISRLDSVNRDILFQLYQSFPRITEYDGVECAWDPKNYPTVWCPSIDTIIFAAALRKKLQIAPVVSAVFGVKPVKTVIDIGCGSGFLGKYAMKKLAALKSPLEKLHFLDIDPNAICCAMDNTKKERGNTAVSYSLSRNPEKLEIDDAYDLVICNPPYIPRPQTINPNPYEGLILLKNILERAKKIISPNGFLLTNFSSLCEKEFKRWTARNKIRYEILSRKKVPLKVLPVISGKTKRSREWLNYLNQKAGCGLEIDKEETSGYRYWHAINIVSIQRGE
ncbi:MAG: methyltransferase [bacterium]|nr:methyltransferase [bacterium]